MSNETFSLHEFEVRASKASKIRDDYYHIIVMGVQCPRCNALNDEIKHSENSRCVECNLRMEVWGNGLFVR